MYLEKKSLPFTFVHQTYIFHRLNVRQGCAKLFIVLEVTSTTLVSLYLSVNSFEALSNSCNSHLFKLFIVLEVTSNTSVSMYLSVNSFEALNNNCNSHLLTAPFSCILEIFFSYLFKLFVCVSRTILSLSYSSAAFT